MLNRVLALSILSTNFFQGALATDSETRSFPLAGIERVQVTNYSGNVEVRSATGSDATVVATKKKVAPKGCRYTVEKSGSKLIVDVDQDGNAACEIDFAITAPQSASVDAKLGAGNLSISDLKGAIEFKLGSGNVALAKVRSSLDGKLGTGSIKASEVESSQVELATGSGEVELKYTVLPKNGEVEVKTGNGNATLYLPADARFQTDFRSGMGSLHSELTETKNAGFKVKMKSGLGDLNIKSAKIEKAASKK